MLAEDQAQTPRAGTRLRLVPVAEFDPELRELVAADDRTPLELGLLRVHAHRPSHAKAIVGLHAALWTDRLLPDRLLELIRLRIAFFNQCKTCMAIRYPGAIADGLTEDLVSHSRSPRGSGTSPRRSPVAPHRGHTVHRDRTARPRSSLALSGRAPMT